jgi:hypothetical protein
MQSIYIFPNNDYAPNFCSNRGRSLRLLCKILYQLVFVKKANGRFSLELGGKLHFLYALYDSLFFAKLRSSIVTTEMLKRYVK